MNICTRIFLKLFDNFFRDYIKLFVVLVYYFITIKITLCENKAALVKCAPIKLFRLIEIFT